MADQGRKPIPKSQKQLSVLQQEPYNEPGPGFQPTGNPNIAEGLNRGAQTSFKDDSVKPLSIGLEDLDGAVMYYFQNVIKPSVIHNEERDLIKNWFESRFLNKPKVWATFNHAIDSNQAVEDTIQNGVKEAHHVDVMKFFDKKMKVVIQLKNYQTRMYFDL